MGIHSHGLKGCPIMHAPQAGKRCGSIGAYRHSSIAINSVRGFCRCFFVFSQNKSRRKRA